MFSSRMLEKSSKCNKKGKSGEKNLMEYLLELGVGWG